MYRMKIDASGEERFFLFHGPGCRKKMLEWWRDQLGRAAAEDIRSICVWGTIGNKNDLVREWVRDQPSRGEAPQNAQAAAAQPTPDAGPESPVCA